MKKLQSIIIRLIEWHFYGLFLITPVLMYHQTSELFEFNKMVFIYIAGLNIFFLWGFRCLIEGRFVFKKTPLDFFLILFLSSQLISLIFSIDKDTSFWGYYGRFNGGLLSLIFYVGLFYAFITNFSPSKIPSLIYFSLVTNFFVIIWGLPGKFGYDLSCWVFTKRLNNDCWVDQFRPSERMFSTFGQPNWLAAYLLINFFILVGVSFAKIRPVRGQFILGNLLGLNYLGILFTRSKTAFLAWLFFVLSLILFFFLVFVILRLKSKKLSDHNFKSLFDLVLGNKYIVLQSLVLILILTFIFKTGIEKVDKLFRIFESIGTTKSVIQNPNSSPSLISDPLQVTDSFKIRKIVWQGAINLAKKYPFFGTGPETFGYAYFQVRPKEHNQTSEWDYIYNKAHNEYLNYLANTGLFGLTTYMLFILVIFFLFLSKITQKTSDHAFTWLNFGIFLSFLSILATNFTGFSVSVINLYFYILIPGILITPCLGIVNKKNFPEHVKNTQTKHLIFGSLVLVILWLFGMVSFVSYWLADFNYAKADFFLKIGRADISEEFLLRALSLKKEHLYMDKLANVYSILALDSAKNNKQREIVENINLAISYSHSAIRSSPKNPIYYKNFAKNCYYFYEATLDESFIKKGIEFLKKASQLSPTDPKIPYSLAVFYYLLSKDKNDEYQNKAIEFIKLSLDLKPNFKDGLLFHARMLIKLDKKSEAKEILRSALKLVNPNDQEILSELKALE